LELGYFCNVRLHKKQAMADGIPSPTNARSRPLSLLTRHNDDVNLTTSFQSHWKSNTIPVPGLQHQYYR
jgi:hypothetical protein